MALQYDDIRLMARGGGGRGGGGGARRWRCVPRRWRRRRRAWRWRWQPTGAFQRGQQREIRRRRQPRRRERQPRRQWQHERQPAGQHQWRQPQQYQQRQPQHQYQRQRQPQHNINNVNVNGNGGYTAAAEGCYNCGWGGHPIAAAAAVTAVAATTAAVIGSVAYSVPPSCGTVVVNGISYFPVRKHMVRAAPIPAPTSNTWFVKRAAIADRGRANGEAELLNRRCVRRRCCHISAAAPRRVRCVAGGEHLLERLGATACRTRRHSPSMIAGVEDAVTRIVETRKARLRIDAHRDKPDRDRRHELALERRGRIGGIRRSSSATRRRHSKGSGRSRLRYWR